MSTRERDAGLRWHLRRGMRELDLILQGFHDEQYGRLSGSERRAFASLLDCEDDDLWVWLTGRGEPERDDLADAVRLIRRHAGL